MPTLQGEARKSPRSVLALLTTPSDSMLPHSSASARIFRILELPLPGSRRPVTHFPAWPLLPAAVVLVFGTTLGAGVLAVGDAVRLSDPTIGTTTCPGERLAWIFSSAHVAGYQPLARLGFWMQRILWNGEPGMFHIVSLTLHGIASLLAYALALRLELRWQAALLVALLFVVHPTRAEVVSWISMQGFLQATVFMLLALNVHAPLLTRARSPGCWRLVVTGVLLLLALLCDPWAASAPLLILVLDIAWRRPLRAALLEKLPLVALSIPFALLALEAAPHPAGSASSWPLQAAAALRVPWLYVERIFWPVEYSAHWWMPPPDRLLSAATVAELLLLGVLLTVLCLSLRRPWRQTAWLALGWPATCILGALLSEAPSGAPAADRDLYLALLGPCLALGVRGCRRAAPGSAPAPLTRLRRLAVIVPVLALGCITYSHVTAFDDTEKLWERSLAAQPDNPVARCALADFLLSGEPDPQKARKALRVLGSGPREAADNQLYRVTRSRVYRTLGDTDQADRELQAAVELTAGQRPRLATVLEHAKWLAVRGEVDAAHASLAAFPTEGWGPRQQVLEGHATLCLMVGDRTGYLRWNAKLLERSPFDLILWYNRVLMAKLAENGEEALRASRRLEELCPPARRAQP